jgi:hypothetical protein
MVCLQATPHALELRSLVRMDVGHIEIKVDARVTALGETGRDIYALRANAELSLAAVDVGRTSALRAR